jgi:hypothetical protein
VSSGSERAALIVQADGLQWMAATAAPAHTSVVTSLPDISELSAMDLASWRAWFIAAARAVMRWVPESGSAIFYQSDIRHAGVWVDKSHLVQLAAEAEAAALVWHTIVCRRPPGTPSWGRASYSHMLCVTRGPIRAPAAPSVHVMPSAGASSWSRGMGMTACEEACRYLREQTETRTVVDPFCGRGSVLRVARESGFDVIGVEISAKRCRIARALLAR